MARLKRIALLGVALWLALVPAAYAVDSALWQQYRQLIRQRQYTTAANLIAPLAKQKDPQACYELAQLYRNGTGIKADSGKARQLLETAARQGHVDSQYLLGVFYSNGTGGDRDLHQARYWLQQAAAHRDSRASRLLSRLGTEVNSNELSADQVRSAAMHGDLATLRAAIAAHRVLNASDSNGNHLLAIAIAGDQRAAAQLLLKQGEKIDHANRYGETALHLAVQGKDPSLVSWLLAQGANPNMRNAAGKTPLHLAVEINNPPLVTALLRAKADPHIKDKDGRTPPDTARIMKLTDVLAAFRQQGVNPVDTTLLQRRLAAARQSGTSVSPLQLAVERDDLVLVKALLKTTQDPWRPNAQGNTVITLAAGHRQSGVLEFLLQHSGGAGWVGQHGRSALFNAIDAGSQQNLETLLAYRLDPLQPDQAGQTPMEFALENGSTLSMRLLKAVPQTRWQSSWLPIAARQGLLDVTLALIASGQDPNMRDRQGRTALWYAAAQGQVAVAKALLSKGADPVVADNDGNTALHKAALSSDTGVMQLLLQRESDQKQINAINHDGSSPLHLAASGGRNAQLKLLLAAGADKDQRDRNGNTPLMLAVLAHDPAGAKVLLDAGASVKKRNGNKQNALAIAQQLGYSDIISLLQKADAGSGVLSIFR